MKQLLQLFIHSSVLLLCSCTNLFHELPRPDDFSKNPEISYTYPSNGDNNIETNKSILILFNRDMEISTITGKTLVVRDDTGNILEGTIQFYGSRVVLFKPQLNMSPGTAHSIFIKKDVKDRKGLSLSSDYSLSFKTGNATDTTQPGLIATIPKDNGTYFPKVSIMAIFTEDMNPFSITGSAFTIERDGAGIDGSVLYNPETRTAVFSPSDPLIVGVSYTANIYSAPSGVKDLAGNSMQTDKTWSFFVVEEADKSQLIVISSTPGNNDLYRAVNSVIMATFNKDIDSQTLTTSSFILKKGSSNIPGMVSYNSETRTAIFTPSGDLDYNSLYTVTILSGSSGVKDLAGGSLLSDKTWSFTTGSRMVNLEDPENSAFGFGTFGDLDGSAPEITGRILTTGYGMNLIDLPGISYDQSLAAIFDPGVSGDLAEGTFIRIVENGKNIMDAAGLALTPYAKSFADGYLSPPPDRVYIDPERGQFVLPGPNYWCKCENISSSLNNPVIAESAYEYNSSGKVWASPLVGKFGNGFAVDMDPNYDYNGSNLQIRPFGPGFCSESGTISLWNQHIFVLVGDNSSYAVTGIKFGNSRVEFEKNLARGNTAKLYVGGTEVGTTIVSTDDMQHIYLLWDRNSGLSGGKSIRIFYNNSEILSYSGVIDTGIGSVEITGWAWRSTSGTERVYLDNIKVWNHVVSEDPAWLHNTGTGREDALHIIYDVNRDYTPAVTGNGNGVGYYYLP